MISKDTYQLYLKLFVDPLKRSGYIYKPDLSSRDWRQTKFYLNDKLIYRFLDDELMIGQFMPQNAKGETWTDRIIIIPDKHKKRAEFTCLLLNR